MTLDFITQIIVIVASGSLVAGVGWLMFTTHSNSVSLKAHDAQYTNIKEELGRIHRDLSEIKMSVNEFGNRVAQLEGSRLSHN